jgi:predicted peptidase
MKKTITTHLSLPYVLYLPRDFGEGQAKKWPLVIFLHGAGERGRDMTLLPRQGLVREVEEGREFPFIMVAPQCPIDWTWDRSLDALDCLLEEIMATQPIDTERIYLTGLSMGGFGTWHWACHQPRAFAALVPICGGAMPLMGFPEKVSVLDDVPIWAFHGADDQVVHVRQTEALVEVLKALDAPVRFTKYAGVGHNSWSRAYSEPELFTWLLGQKNKRFQFERGDCR